MAHTYRLPKFNLELADKLVSRKHSARLAQKFRLYIAYDDSPEPGIVPVAVLPQKTMDLQETGWLGTSRKFGKPADILPMPSEN